MDSLLSLMNDLNISIQHDKNNMKSIIYEHIKKAEEQNFVAEEFPSGLDWFNVSEPITTSMLHGKIVILDFFTYCCINCLHMLPKLRKLEECFSVEDGLVVIGVHSSKFDNEKDSKNIKQALKKYNVSHPVVNDSQTVLWHKYDVFCWPTLLVLGPNKKFIFAIPGDDPNHDIGAYISNAINYYKDVVSSSLLPIIHTEEILHSNILKFPGKITRWGNNFAVSDSGNHRILVFNSTGQIEYKIGGSKAGFKDGNFEEALFNSPQGIVFYDSSVLYIADTENHAIRLANMKELTVTTVVGNGCRGNDFIGGRQGISQELSSPWDICIVHGSDIETHENMAQDTTNRKENNPVRNATVSPLEVSTRPDAPPLPPPPPPPPVNPPEFLKKPKVNAKEPKPVAAVNQLKKMHQNTSKVLLIAAAGTHQIWAYFIDPGTWWKGKNYVRNVCIAVAGNGKEQHKNNTFPHMASFAQPSGLSYSTDLKAVFVADSESSTVRKLSTKNGTVTHVVGGSKFPEDLFSFGDKDGTGYNVRLQHPMGIAWHPQKQCIVVCDTYNNKIKLIDAESGKCSSLHEESDLFSEPNGCCLSEDGNIIFVCDTNNNEIKTIDLANGNTIRQFKLIDDSRDSAKDSRDSAKKIVKEAECVICESGGKLLLKMDFSPSEIHGKWKLNVDEDQVRSEALTGTLTSNTLDLPLEVAPAGTNVNIQLVFSLMLCGSQLCASKNVVVNVVARREKTKQERKETTCSVKINLL